MSLTCDLCVMHKYWVINIKKRMSEVYKANMTCRSDIDVYAGADLLWGKWGKRLGPHHLGGPHQNFNAVSKVDFYIA